MDIETQETERTLNRSENKQINKRPLYGVFKSPRQRENSKTSREKFQVMFKGTSIKLKADFQQKPTGQERDGMTALKKKKRKKETISRSERTINHTNIFNPLEEQIHKREKESTLLICKTTKLQR
jgi:hypothetical protein